MKAAPGSDASCCPLCGEPNDCALASAAESADPSADPPCWCVGREFPSELLDRLDAQARGRRCVCRSCLDRAVSG
ncbi:MAG: cysteine-rich CWC family protein [Deltaproteobacteria bacterium]|nr:cysteine-rich CWC family protein [Deltaproteobacteria bacterium]MBW2497516.1 cysteine-rich CWC family protein [Deltaproteobacteria bacterium]